jgi:hypothetical protein
MPPPAPNDIIWRGCEVEMPDALDPSSIYQSGKRTRVEFSPLRDRDEFLPSTSDEDDEPTRLRKKARREQAASDYLHYGSLQISTARLKGPFDQGWKNPWSKKKAKVVIDLTGESTNDGSSILNERPSNRDLYKEELPAVKNPPYTTIMDPKAIRAPTDSLSVKRRRMEKDIKLVDRILGNATLSMSLEAGSKDIPQKARNLQGQESVYLTSDEGRPKSKGEEFQARRTSDLDVEKYIAERRLVELKEIINNLNITRDQDDPRILAEMSYLSTRLESIRNELQNRILSTELEDGHQFNKLDVSEKSSSSNSVLLQKHKRNDASKNTPSHTSRKLRKLTRKIIQDNSVVNYRDPSPELFVRDDTPTPQRGGDSIDRVYLPKSGKEEAQVFKLNQNTNNPRKREENQGDHNSLFEDQDTKRNNKDANILPKKGPVLKELEVEDQSDKVIIPSTSIAQAEEANDGQSESNNDFGMQIVHRTPDFITDHISPSPKSSDIQQWSRVLAQAEENENQLQDEDSVAADYDNILAKANHRKHDKDYTQNNLSRSEHEAQKISRIGRSYPSTDQLQTEVFPLQYSNTGKSADRDTHEQSVTDYESASEGTHSKKSVGEVFHSPTKAPVTFSYIASSVSSQWRTNSMVGKPYPSHENGQHGVPLLSAQTSKGSEYHLQMSEGKTDSRSTETTWQDAQRTGWNNVDTQTITDVIEEAGIFLDAHNIDRDLQIMREQGESELPYHGPSN